MEGQLPCPTQFLLKKSGCLDESIHVENEEWGNIWEKARKKPANEASFYFRENTFFLKIRLMLPAR
jgi:hypothetical protein